MNRIVTIAGALLARVKLSSSVRASQITMAAVALISVGCADAETQISIKYASDYVQPTSALSVFGVFENGRLSPESWQDIGPVLSSRISRTPCEAAWGANFLSANPSLTTAIDEYSKDEGVSDELIQRLEPLAKGDAILTLIVFNPHPDRDNAGNQKSRRSATPAPASVGGGFGARGGGRAMRGFGRGPQPSASAAESDDSTRRGYQISASLYSIRRHHSVAVISMTVSGSNLETALQEFASKLHSAVPAVTCTGWNLSAPIDAGRVRELLNQPVPEPKDE